MRSAPEFYKTKAWKKTQKAYLSSRNYLCERCGSPADLVHHKVYITPENKNDPHITLDWTNLEALCLDCHNKEHFGKSAKVRFDPAGSVLSISDTPDTTRLKQEQRQLQALLSVLDNDSLLSETNTSAH